MNLSIDTNAYRAFIDGKPEIVEAIQDASSLAFSAVVLGELRAGFRNGTRQVENEAVLNQILSRRRVRVHEITEGTTSFYAGVWTDLRKRGLPIPTNDLWIAAQCLETGFSLLTLDTHFHDVVGLNLCRY